VCVCFSFFVVFFFFSSRRRHTRCYRDWSSDVCSSDLSTLSVSRVLSSQLFGITATDPLTFMAVALLLCLAALTACYIPARRAMRSEERRVGKEWRYGVGEEE